MSNRLYSIHGIAPSYRTEEGYLDDKGNIFKNTPGGFARDTCIGYVKSGFLTNHIGVPSCDMCVYVNKDPGVLSNNEVLMGHIDHSGNIYSEKSGTIGHVQGNQIFQGSDPYSGRVIGESEESDLRIGAALLLGLFEGGWQESAPNDSFEAPKNNNSNSGSGGSTGSEPPRGFSLGGIILALFLLYVGASLGLVPYAILQSTYNPDKGPVPVIVAAACVIPILVIGTLAMIALIGKKGDRKKRTLAFLFTTILIILLSVIYCFFAIYDWMPIWELWKFRSPASIPFFIYWLFRLAYAISIAILIKKSDWAAIKKIRVLNGFTAFIVILQLSMWAMITQAGEIESFYFYSYIMVGIWALTNIPVWIAIKKR